MPKHIVADVEYVKCPYCPEGPKNKFKMLHWKHLKSLHIKTLEDVLQEFPEYPTMTLAQFEKKCATSKMGTQASKLTCHDMKTIYCIHCKEEIEVRNNESNVQACRVCLNKGLENPDGRTKEQANVRRTETIQERYGDDVTNIQQIPGVTKQMVQTQTKKYGGVGFASEDLAKKSRDKIKEKFGDENIMKTEEGIKKFIKSLQQKYGKEVTNPLHILEVIKQVSETKRGQPSKLKGRTYEDIHGEEKAKQLREEKHFNGAKGYQLSKQTSPEQLQLYKLVREVFPFAKLEYEVFGYFLDIAIPEYKLCIEYGASFWHESNKYHPDKEEHDQIRERILSSLGWKVVNFLDNVPTREELTKEIQEVLNK